MPESEARDWVLVWVEDLHRRAGGKRFWEKEQKRIDLMTCCLILSCRLWEVRPMYFPKAAGQNQTTCLQIYPFLLFFPKTLTLTFTKRQLLRRLLPITRICAQELRLSMDCMHFVVFSFCTFALKKISRLHPLVNTRDLFSSRLTKQQ